MLSVVVRALMMAANDRFLKFLSANSAYTASGNSVTVTAPSEIRDGGTLVLVFAGAGSSAPTITPPSGFTQRYLLNSGGRIFGVWTKATSGESGDYTISHNGSGWTMTATVGFWADSEVDTVGTGASANTANITGAGITPSTVGALLFIGGRPFDALAVATPPSGMVQRVLNNSNVPNTFIYEVRKQAASATGDKVLVASDSRQSNSLLIQLRTL